jgi:predicted RNA polymerase sigma factor
MPSPVVRGPAFTGFVLADGRRGGICWDEKPRCVAGHRLHTKQKQPIISEALTTCVHKASREAEPCGIQQFVQVFTVGGSARIQGQGERAWLAVQVTRDHVERMRREPMIFLERMVILGVALPGVELDLTGDLQTENDDAPAL